MRWRAAKIAAAHLAALLLFLTISYLFYAPPPHPAGFVYLGYGTDPLAYIWFLNWWPFALRHHLPLLHTIFADYPVGQNLAWRTSVPSLGLLAALPGLGARQLYNALMLASAGLAGWGAYLAAFELTANWPAAIAAGLIFAGSGYEIGQLQGHLNLALIVAVPLCLWLFARAANHRWPPSRLALCLGPLLAWQFGVSQELFATCIIAGACCLAGSHAAYPALRPRLLPLAAGGAAGVALSLILVSPLLVPMILTAGAGHDAVAPDPISNDLLSFFIPTPNLAFGGRLFAPLTARFAGNGSEQGSYFGVPLLLLLAAVERRHQNLPVIRVAAVTALAAALLSLGPFIQVLGKPIIPGPWLIGAKLPLIGTALPARFILFAWLAAAMLFACWLALPGSPPARLARYLTLAAALVLITPNRALVRHWSSVTIPEIFTAAARPVMPRGATIVILPYQGHEMAYQLTSNMGFYLAGQGYLGIGVPPPFARWPLFPALYHNQLAAIDPVEFATYLAAYGVEDAVVDTTFPNAPAAITLLQKAGWIATTTDAATAGATATAILFRPAHPTPPDPERIAAYLEAAATTARRAHQAKLLKMESLRICQIRNFAGFAGLNPAPLTRLYLRLTHTPQPPGQIACGKR